MTVAVTPNGYADAPYLGKFVMPEERVMAFGTVLDILDKKKNPAGIFYVQKQNSSFKDEFQELIPDAESHIPWATEAFGTESKHGTVCYNLYILLRFKANYILIICF